jgi:hypothetical protein
MVAAAVPQRSTIAAIANVARITSPVQYHFLIAACRAKKANSAAGSIGKSSQITSAKPVEVWAGFSRRFQRRTIWIADAHGYGRRFIVRADELLTAFVELEREALTVTFYLESIHPDSCR